MMENKLPSDINESDIFTCSFYYFNASLRCWKVEKNTNNVAKTLFIPAMSNAAFACELAIKAIYYKFNHHAADNKHDLYDLLMLLPKDNVDSVIENLETKGYKDVNQILKEYGKSFVEWRYFYEFKNCSFLHKLLLDYYNVLEEIYNTPV